MKIESYGSFVANFISGSRKYGESANARGHA